MKTSGTPEEILSLGSLINYSLPWKLEAPSRRPCHASTSGAVKGRPVPPPEPILRLCRGSRCTTSHPRDLWQNNEPNQAKCAAPRNAAECCFSICDTRAWWLMAQVSLTPMSATSASPSTDRAPAGPARRATGCPWMSLSDRESLGHPFSAEGNCWIQSWRFVALGNISPAPPWWWLLWEHCQGTLSLMGKWIQFSREKLAFAEH